MTKRTITLLVVTAVGLATFLFSGSVRAGLSTLLSSEPAGFEVVAKVPEIIGDDPDEAGYTGELPAVSNGVTIASEEGVGGTAVDKATPLQPDDIGYTGEIPAATTINNATTEEGEALPPTDWSKLYDGPQPDEPTTPETPLAFGYLRAAGTTFKPRTNYLVNWGYGGAGCMYNVTSNSMFHQAIDLPNGLEAQYLRLYYYDTNAVDATLWLTSYDATGGLLDITSVSTEGTAGYGTTLSPLFHEVANNSANAYVLNWLSSTTDNTIRLCGARLAYQLP